MSSSLDIVIVNWNTGVVLAECLDSVAAAGLGVAVHRVVVVDNASTDQSIEWATSRSASATVIRNLGNRGFAAACNQGAAGSAADYLLFLNPDTRLNVDTLTATLAFMDAPAQHDVGICGIRLVDVDGQPSTAAARFPSPRLVFGEATGLSRLLPQIFPRHLLTAAECGTTRDVDQVIGAYFLIRRALFDRLGGFDERFFVYYEEVDLSLRAARAGFRSVFFAGAEAVHHGGVSSQQVKAARLFYSLRGRLLYAHKHFSPFGAAIVHLVTFGVEWPVRLVRGWLQGGTARQETMTGFRRLRAFVTTPGWRHSLDEQRRS